MESIFLILAFAVVLIWWLKARGGINQVDVDPITEQKLAQLQTDFERRLTSCSDLPDGIRGRDAFTYWTCMSKWFDRLIAENRYDTELTEKLRQDWFEYIKLLPSAKTARFLALETSDEAKAEIYSQQAESAVRSIKRIEDAFASAIGSDAVELLRQIRSRDADSFDRSGRKPIAPEGHHYFPVSISPYAEQCQPKPSGNAA